MTVLLGLIAVIAVFSVIRPPQRSCSIFEIQFAKFSKKSSGLSNFNKCESIKEEPEFKNLKKYECPD